MQGIPLFQEFFWSSSVNFKAERLWILRLLYTGLNLEDDAQIYIRNSIIETLLSVYVSPLTDNDSKELILQVISELMIVTSVMSAILLALLYCVSSCLFFWIIF